MSAGQPPDQVARMIAALGDGPLSSSELRAALDLVYRPSVRINYLNPALSGGWIERTQPEAPRSPTQRYRLTAAGRSWL